jgi:ketosteroid isomerase-like protein
MKTNTKTQQLILALMVIALAVFLASCKPARPTDPVAIVQAAYDRLNEGDIDGYMEFLSDDAVSVGPFGRQDGAEAIRADLEGSVGPNLEHFEITKITLDGNVVYLNVNIYKCDQYVAKDMFAAVVVDGKIIYDGRATELSIECYHDPSQAFCPGD